MNYVPKRRLFRGRRHDRKSAFVRLALLLCFFFGLAQALAVPAESVTAIDKGLIVDCKLPPRLAQLGAHKAMLMPGGVEKVSKAECEIRGGLYVAYDAADPATALKIWMDSANQGDAQAQNRVGQIYELGIGLAPDYEQAAKWYLKAAQNGSRAAAVNLASLYDRALIVPKDTAAVSELYRKAMGLTEAGKAPEGVPPASESAADLLDVGAAAGAKPAIILQDPQLVVTRGDNEVRLRAEIKTKDISGRVIARSGVASLKVNDRDAAIDRFGYFSASVPVSPEGTKVSIVAIDKQGARDQAVFVLLPGAAIESVANRAPQLAPGQTGKFHALVIGNRRYNDSGWSELPNSESDARSVASLLERKYGFARPRLLIDATREQILGALNDYVKTLGPSDNLLIYYAGHGTFKLGKRGYWVPVDGGKEDDTNWIDNVRIADVLLKMNARKVLLVSDSCYAAAMIGTENGGVATIRPGLSDVDFIRAADSLAKSTSRTVLGSGGLAPVLEGGVNNHSIFANAFLEVLEANSQPMEGYRLFLALDGKVLKRAQQQHFNQAPVYAGIALGGHEGGDFVFFPSATKPRAALPYSATARLAMRAR